MPDTTAAGQDPEPPRSVYVSLDPALASSPLRRALAAAGRRPTPPPLTPTRPATHPQENQTP
jgi:hypothetical protein